LCTSFFRFLLRLTPFTPTRFFDSFHRRPSFFFFTALSGSSMERAFSPPLAYRFPPGFHVPALHLLGEIAWLFSMHPLIFSNANMLPYGRFYTNGGGYVAQNFCFLFFPSIGPSPVKPFEGHSIFPRTSGSLSPMAGPWRFDECFGPLNPLPPSSTSNRFFLSLDPFLRSKMYSLSHFHQGIFFRFCVPTNPFPSLEPFFSS